MLKKISVASAILLLVCILVSIALLPFAIDDFGKMVSQYETAHSGYTLFYEKDTEGISSLYLCDYYEDLEIVESPDGVIRRLCPGEHPLQRFLCRNAGTRWPADFGTAVQRPERQQLQPGVYGGPGARFHEQQQLQFPAGGAQGPAGKGDQLLPPHQSPGAGRPPSINRNRRSFPNRRKAAQSV